MLGKLITSKTRLRLLIKFFISQANRGYLNGLANEMGESTNSIRKELNHLYGAGYLKKVKVDNKVEYKANTDHPLFEVLRKVVFKHLGLEDVVETVLAPVTAKVEPSNVKLASAFSAEPVEVNTLLLLALLIVVPTIDPFAVIVPPTTMLPEPSIANLGLVSRAGPVSVPPAITNLSLSELSTPIAQSAPPPPKIKLILGS